MTKTNDFFLINEIEKYNNYCAENKIKLTIFVPTYNRSDFLKDCIKSILDQDFKEYAVFILDNCSNDDTGRLCNEFKLKYNNIFYHKNSVNIGGINNLNLAIKMSCTEYFMIFHDDDTMKTSLVSKEILTLMKDDSIVAIGSRYETYSIRKYIKFGKISIKDNCVVYEKYDYIKNWLSGGQVIPCPSIMFRTNFIKKNNIFFDEKAGPACDCFLLSEINRKGGKLCLLFEHLFNYRMHDNQDSKNNLCIMDVKLINYFLGSKNYDFESMGMKKQISSKLIHNIIESFSLCNNNERYKKELLNELSKVNHQILDTRKEIIIKTVYKSLSSNKLYLSSLLNIYYKCKNNVINTLYNFKYYLKMR